MLHEKWNSKTQFIFDFDGTVSTLLIDWKEWHKGMLEIFRFFEPTFETDDANFKAHLFQNDFFRKYGKACRDQVAIFSSNYELKHSVGIRPNDVVLKLIQNIKVGDLYLWSSNSRKPIEKYLSQLGILNRFAKLVTRDDVFCLKPDIEGFSLISDGRPLDQYLFFGDSIYDKKAAQAIGIDYVDVKSL